MTNACPHCERLRSRIAELERLLAAQGDKMLEMADSLRRAAERQDRGGAPDRVGFGVIHYAPFGRNAAGTFDCGGGDGCWTSIPSLVSCDGCKARTPGAWPSMAPLPATPNVAELDGDPTD